MTAVFEQIVVGLDVGARPLPVSMSEPDAIRVLLIEDGVIDHEFPCDELSKQGFVIRGFGDSGALLGALRDAVDVDVIVVLLKESSLDLLIKLQWQGVNVPVVFLGARALPAQADVVRKLQGLEVLARRLRGVALESVVKAFGPTDQAQHDGSMICGRLFLRPDVSRASWKDTDLGLTLGEYNIVHLLVSNVGRYVTYRATYDRLHYEGFIAGAGADGYRANVRSAIKRIRNKFRAVDPTFDEIENYNGFGYCWKKPD
jgi:two-component system response regulator ChvI